MTVVSRFFLWLLISLPFLLFVAVAVAAFCGWFRKHSIFWLLCVVVAVGIVLSVILNILAWVYRPHTPN